MRHFARNRSRGFARAAVVLLPCLLLLSACKGGGEGEAQAKAGEDKKGPEAVPVEVAKASRRAVAASYTGTAPLEPVAESQVVAKTSGVALNVMVEEGQPVRAGQTLVRLDSARAELQAAQTGAAMRKLEANYSRARQMAEQKLLSANDNDQLRYDLENARAANRLANLELSYANVEAPISGVIASRRCLFSVMCCITALRNAPPAPPASNPPRPPAPPIPAPISAAMVPFPRVSER